MSMALTDTELNALADMVLERLHADFAEEDLDPVPLQDDSESEREG